MAAASGTPKVLDGATTKMLLSQLQSGASSSKQAALTSLKSFVSSPESRSEFASVGGLSLVVKALSVPQSSVFMPAAKLLIAFADDEAHRKIIMEEDGVIKVLIGLMDKKNGDTFRYVIELLVILGETPESRTAMVAEGVIAALVQGLGDKNQSVRQNAIQILLHLMTDSEAREQIISGILPQLIPLLADKKVEIQDSVVEILVKLAEEETFCAAMIESKAIQPMLLILQSSVREPVCKGLMTVLGSLAKDTRTRIPQVMVDIEVVPLLAGLLESKQESVREHIAAILKNLVYNEAFSMALGRAGAFSFITGLLGEESDLLQRHAVLVFGKIMLTGLSQERRQALLASVPRERMLVTLVSFLRDTAGRDIQRYSLEILLDLVVLTMEEKLELASYGMISPLIELLHHEDPEFQLCSIALLRVLAFQCPENQQEILNAGGASALVDLLGSIHFDVLNKAIQLLGALAFHDPKKQAMLAEAGALSALLALLNKGDTGFEESLLIAIVELTYEHTENQLQMVSALNLDVVLQLLDSDHLEMQQSLVLSLTMFATHQAESHDKIASEIVLKRLVGFLGKGDFSLCAYTTYVLQSLTQGSRKNQELLLSLGVVPYLIDLLAEDCPKITPGISAILGSLAELEQGMAAMTKAGMISFAVQFLEHETALVRYNAILTLAQSAPYTSIQKNAIAEAGAIPILLKFLRDKDVEIRSNAILALAAITVEHPKNQDEVRDQGGMVLLVGSLSDVSTDIRINAAEILWYFAANDAKSKQMIVRDGGIAPLAALLYEEDAYIRRNAVWALGALARENVENQTAIADAGIIPLLLKNLTDKELASHRTVLLIGELAAGNPRNQSLIADSGAVPLLLEYLQYGDQDLQEKAIYALESLATRHRANQDFIVASGAVPILKKLLFTERKDQIRVSVAKVLLALLQGNKESQGLIANRDVIECLVALVKLDRSLQAPVVDMIKELVCDHPEYRDRVDSGLAIPFLVELFKKGELVKPVLETLQTILLLEEESFVNVMKDLVVVNLLTALLEDKEADTCNHAFTLLSRVASADVKIADKTRLNIIAKNISIDALISLLRRSDIGDRQAASQFLADLTIAPAHLGRIGTDKMLMTLNVILSEEKDLLIRQGILEALVQLVQDAVCLNEMERVGLIPCLTGLIKDKEPQAVAILARLSEREENQVEMRAAIFPLISVLNDANLDIRRNAVAIIMNLLADKISQSNMMASGVVAPLISLLQDDDLTVRQNAVLIIASLAETKAYCSIIVENKALPELVTLLKKDDTDLRIGMAAISTLDMLTMHESCLLDFARAGEIATLIALLQIEDPGIKNKALSILSRLIPFKEFHEEMAVPEIVVPVAQMLVHSKSKVPADVVVGVLDFLRVNPECLEKMESEFVIQPLVDLLKSASSDLRFTITDILSNLDYLASSSQKIWNASGVPTLMSMLQHERPVTQNNILKILTDIARLGETQKIAIGKLVLADCCVSLMRSADISLQQNTCRLLQHIINSENLTQISWTTITPVLFDLLSHKDTGVLADAVRVLAVLVENKYYMVEAKERLIPALLEHVQDGKSGIQHASLALLAKLAKKEKVQEWMCGSGVMPVAFDLSGSTDSEIRQSSVEMLLRFTESEAGIDHLFRAGGLPLLMRLLEDPVVGVRRNAILAIENLASIEALQREILEVGVSPLLALLEDEKNSTFHLHSLNVLEALLENDVKIVNEKFIADLVLLLEARNHEVQIEAGNILKLLIGHEPWRIEFMRVKGVSALSRSLGDLNLTVVLNALSLLKGLVSNSEALKEISDSSENIACLVKATSEDKPKVQNDVLEILGVLAANTEGILALEKSKAIPGLVGLVEKISHDRRYKVFDVLAKLTETSKENQAALCLNESRVLPVLEVGLQSVGSVETLHNLTQLLAVIAKGAFGLLMFDGKTVHVLVKLLQHEDKSICLNAATALGHLQYSNMVMIGAGIMPILFGMIEDENIEVRCCVINMLSKLSDQKECYDAIGGLEILSLVRMLQDKALPAVVAASHLLKQLIVHARVRTHVVRADLEWIPVILELLDSKDWDIRKNVAGVLANILVNKSYPMESIPSTIIASLVKLLGEGLESQQYAVMILSCLTVKPEECQRVLDGGVALPLVRLLDKEAAKNYALKTLVNLIVHVEAKHVSEWQETVPALFQCLRDSEEIAVQHGLLLILEALAKYEACRVLMVEEGALSYLRKCAKKEDGAKILAGRVLSHFEGVRIVDGSKSKDFKVDAGAAALAKAPGPIEEITKGISVETAYLKEQLHTLKDALKKEKEKTSTPLAASDGLLDAGRVMSSFVPEVDAMRKEFRAMEKEVTRRMNREERDSFVKFDELEYAVRTNPEKKARYQKTQIIHANKSLKDFYYCCRRELITLYETSAVLMRGKIESKESDNLLAYIGSATSFLQDFTASVPIVGQAIAIVGAVASRVIEQGYINAAKRIVQVLPDLANTDEYLSDIARDLTLAHQEAIIALKPHSQGWWAKTLQEGKRHFFADHVDTAAKKAGVGFGAGVFAMVVAEKLRRESFTPEGVVIAMGLTPYVLPVESVLPALTPVVAASSAMVKTLVVERVMGPQDVAAMSRQFRRMKTEIQEYVRRDEVTEAVRENPIKMYRRRQAEIIGSDERLQEFYQYCLLELVTISRTAYVIASGKVRSKESEGAAAQIGAAAAFLQDFTLSIPILGQLVAVAGAIASQVVAQGYVNAAKRIVTALSESDYESLDGYLSDIAKELTLAEQEMIFNLKPNSCSWWGRLIKEGKRRFLADEVNTPAKRAGLAVGAAVFALVVAEKLSAKEFTPEGVLSAMELTPYVMPEVAASQSAEARVFMRLLSSQNSDAVSAAASTDHTQEVAATVISASAAAVPNVGATHGAVMAHSRGVPDIRVVEGVQPANSPIQAVVFKKEEAKTPSRLPESSKQCCTVM